MTGRRDNNDSKSVGQRREEEEQCANKRNSNEGDEPIYMGGKQALKVRVTSDPPQNKESSHPLKKKDAQERKKMRAPPM